MKSAPSLASPESTLVAADQALILRLNLQSRPLRLAHYEFRHPSLHNERREPQERLLPNRDLLKLTRAARAMVLFLVSIRRRFLERGRHEAAPCLTWEGPSDSPVACLAEALHLSSQAWLKAWFGFFPPRISKTKSLASLFFPHSNTGGKPASVSLRQPNDPGQTCPGFRPLRPASIRVFSSKTEELDAHELGRVEERLFQEGGWQTRPYWSDEPPDSPAPAPRTNRIRAFRSKYTTGPAGQTSEEIVLEGDSWTLQRTRTTDPVGRTAEEVVLNGDWPLEQFPGALDQILQGLAQGFPPGTHAPGSPGRLTAPESSKGGPLLLLPVTVDQARELARLVKEGESGTCRCPPSRACR